MLSLLSRLVLSVKNNRSRDKIVLPLTPAIRGTLFLNLRVSPGWEGEGSQGGQGTVLMSYQDIPPR